MDWKKGGKVRVFVDTSVLIPALASPSGAARMLLNHGLLGTFELYVSDIVLEETERNISLKLPRIMPNFLIFKKAISAPVVAPKDFVILASGWIALKDAPIVAAAAFIHADYLATFDRKDLIANGKSEEIKANTGVISTEPAEILRELHMFSPSKAA